MLAALKEVRLLGHDYVPGEAVPDSEWAKVPERNRRALQSTRIIGPMKAPRASAGKAAAPKKG